MTTSTMVARDGAACFARAAGRPVSVGEFCADVAACADALPEARSAINLCQDRYAFTVAFFAVLQRGQTNLLPAQRDPGAALELRRHHGAARVLTDQALEGADLVLDIDPGSNGARPSPQIDVDHPAAIAFTSGSTGTPQPHEKRWGMLAEWRAVHWRYLAGAAGAPRSLVATVPSWHMYGLEWAMLMPTAAPVTVHCGADFYPADVIAALDECEHETVLVSTPTHLRALTKAPPPARPVGTVVSATAPLEPGLVEQVEARLGGRVLEIYGCSEVGSLAWRLPRTRPVWEFFDCFETELDAGEITIRHPALAAPVTLADRFSEAPTGGFNLEGRATDIVKVGGQRESLANLNGVLVSIDGVEDGIFYRPEDHGLAASDRLAAVVVAPGMTGQDVRGRLAGKVGPAFLPRPVHVVQALPRDKTSKLKKDALTVLVRELHG